MPETARVRAARTLNVATWNVLRGRPGRNVTAFLTRYLAKHEIDVIALQEVKGYHAALRAVKGYDLVVFPSSRDKGDEAFLIRHGVKHGPGAVWNVYRWWRAAKGGRFKARSIVTVQADGWLRLANVHAPVSVLNHSGRFQGAKARIAAYKNTASRLVALFKKSTKRGEKAQMALGDWNASITATGVGTPTWAANKLGMTKHRGGRIDWAMTKGCAIDSVVVDRADKGDSDHAPVRYVVREKVAVEPGPTKPKPGVHQPPSPPFIAARWFGGAQVPRTIVIHGTVSPCVKGGARAVARFFAQRPASGKTSAHYTVDPGEVIQSVGDHSVAYHCGHNQDSLGIELCDPQAGRGARWADIDHKAMLARAATLVAQLCLAYGIPATRVMPSALKAGKHGICGHVDMSNAFHASTHTDPGPDFPWSEFIHAVKAEIARLEK